MKLLVISRLYMPHMGGVEKEIQGRNKLLLKRGFEITTVSEKYEESLLDEENIDGERVIRFAVPKIKYLGLFYIWYWLYKHRNLIEQTDLVQVHDVFVWYLPFRFIFPDIPVYTTFHGWEGVYPIPWKNIFLRRIGARLSSGYICGGAYIKKWYGIDVKDIVLTPLNVPKKLSLKKEKKSIVYIGRLHQDTGLLKILRSLDFLEGFSVDFCGDGPLRDICKKYGRVHGFVDPVPFYQKAEISIAAGYNAVMEAMAYGCLVITTYDNPLKKDYLKMTPFAKWIIIEKSPEKMARKIVYYSKNRKKALPYIKDGYNWVKTQTWEKLTRQYLDLWGVR